MVSSITDMIRKNIINKNSKEMTFLNIENLDYDFSREVIRLFLSDHYKINFFECMTEDDYSYLEDFNTPIEVLIDKALKDTQFLSDIIESSITFDSLSNITKTIIIEMLQEQDKEEEIMDISKLYLFDKYIYTFNYDLDSFKDYYIDYKNKQNNKTSDVVFHIANKLLDFKEENYDKFKELILEFIKIYYKWNVFVRENCPKNSIYKTDYINLQVLKYNNIDAIMYYAENDFDFLQDIIDGYLYYSTCEKQVSEEIVDEYIFNNTDVEIQKKLKLKRD